MACTLGDGLKIAAMLKDKKETKAIPILATSTLDFDFVRTAVKLVECDDYLTKPFTIKNLVTVLGNLKQKTETKRWGIDKK